VLLVVVSHPLNDTLRKAARSHATPTAAACRHEELLWRARFFQGRLLVTGSTGARGNAGSLKA
jgi:hypothetical protein